MRSLGRALLLLVVSAASWSCGARSEPEVEALGETDRLSRLTGTNADTCLLDRDGEVRCWGQSFGVVPRAVPGASPAIDVAVLPLAIAAAAPTALVCVIDPAGEVKCIGADGSVTSPGIVGARQIAAGPAHAGAVAADGRVWCWGENGTGQLGDGTTASRAEPAPVEGVAGAVEVACGEFATCARLSDGRVQCWGSDYAGALGDGASAASCGDIPCSTLPVDVELEGEASEIRAGLNGACARQAGRLRCWGWNGAGEVGDGSTTDRDAPVLVEDLVDSVSAYAGYLRKCAVRTGGEVACWGFPTGTGGGEAGSPTPTAVAGLPPIVEVAGGWYHLCALDRDDVVLCWGDNEWGQLGDGTLVSRSEPAPTK